MPKNTTPMNGKKRVSYSQFNDWWKCRHKFYLDRIKGLRKSEDSVATCFGTTMHEAIQLYIKTLYVESAKSADLHDLYEIFKRGFDRELSDKKVKIEDGVYKEHCDDGKNIIDAFTNVSNRIKHFPSNKYEFIGVEDEIITPIKNDVEFICYIDVVLKEKSTGRYRIIDIKTSTQGWNHYQREDEGKIAQILLYKAFFSRKYNIDINMIDVEFFILRRKLWENYNFPQSHLQLFTPKNDQKSIARALNFFAQFVDECFTTDGKFIEDPKIYLKNPGKAYKNCKWCSHKKINCFPTKEDIDKDD